ncbi:DMT family transporter [Marinobacter bohaiensis]|uniref:DMT family transporter n=1 Tax=Marinobacter bohaiensis TaxID=2201898 RepID=UPI000DABBABD|nr:DMT family transporter [Marinobacter bohaiensis]
MQKKHLFFLLLILGTAFWGVSFAYVKAGVADGSPFVFLTYKFALAALALAVLFAKRFRRLDWNTIFAGTLIGLPLLFGNVFQTIGLQHTSVTNTAFITGLDVLLIPFFKWSFFRKPVKGRIWVSCSVALLGLYLIVAKHGLNLNAGDIWVMACAVFFASYVMTVGCFAHRFDAMLTVIVAMTVCSLGSGLGAIFDEQAIWIPSEMQFWKGVLITGLLGTAYMYGIQSSAQKYIEEEKVALTYLCEPIFAAVAGVIMLGESLNARTIFGGLLILVALLIAELDLKCLRPREPKRGGASL